MIATILYELGGTKGQFHAETEDGRLIFVVGNYKVGQSITIKGKNGK